MTLREIETVFAGVVARRKNEHIERAWLAWHTGVLTRVQKLPRLADLLPDEPQSRKLQSRASMLAAAMTWNARINRTE